MPKDKIDTSTVIRVNAYAVMSRAVEEGVHCGYSRCNKHGPTLPDSSTEEGQRSIETIAEYVMTELAQWFEFMDPSLDPLSAKLAPDDVQQGVVLTLDEGDKP